MGIQEYIALGFTLFMFLAIGYMAIFLLSKWKQIRIPKNTILAFMGSLGMGKTFISVKEGIKHHRKMIILYYLGKIIKKNGLPKVRPKFYSNMPIHFKLIPIIGKKHSAIKISFYHISGLQQMTEYCTVFITELGEIADQYSFNNPIVMIYLQKFVRLFRHWLDGKFIWDDQASDNVAKPIRLRTNVIYNLINFKRWLFIFYKVNVQRISIINDLQTVEETSDYGELPFFVGLLPFKFFTFLNKIFFFMPPKKYDSRTYSVTYRPIYDENHNEIVYEKESLLFDFDFSTQLKTNYFMTLPSGKELQQEYKTNGHVPLERLEYYISEYEKLLKLDDDYIEEKMRNTIEKESTKAENPKKNV